ncbi:hypothetical protein [Celerinatantimonas sp. YJH-8]|uniref:hypothetical protein n=1 Tax=Celerinatantimonas sp. YJH-8 TaxID=3228714 RepID=UPI0038BE35F7
MAESATDAVVNRHLAKPLISFQNSKAAIDPLQWLTYPTTLWSSQSTLPRVRHYCMQSQSRACALKTDLENLMIAKQDIAKST